MSSEPRTVTSVGAIVTLGDSLLVARLTYSPTRGQYMLPGGVVEPGEALDAAIVREVREECGIETRPLGIAGVSSIVYQGDTHTYLFWSMEAVSGEPRPDGREVDDCRFLTFEEIAARDDVSYLVKYVAKQVQRGRLVLHTQADDYVNRVAGLTPETWKLFI